jgi:Zn finger protein HypA/HybF involved in hydrogenase expression
VTVEPLNRTLEQELNALLRGASLECLACGEFVMHLPQGGIFCPECGSGLDVALGAEPAVPVSRSGGR